MTRDLEWVYDAKPTAQDAELPAGDMQAIQEALRSPSRADVGDEWVTCPGCSRDVLVSELCECDREDGPKCLHRCCEMDHPVGRPFGGEAA